MASVQEHYETVLADHYTWMFGASFEDMVAEQTGLLRKMGVNAPSTAVDLGCGSGFQTFALSKLGATKVYAIDTSRKLLDELDGRIHGESIETVCGDLLHFLTLVPQKADTIICMGDTVTHLPNREAVSRLFRDVAAGLAPDGRFVLSYRDFTQPVMGLDRFIPLRSSPDRIMTCFLERVGDRLMVHDLIHVRQADGWTVLKSAYPKLILPFDEIKQELAGHGLNIEFEESHRGMRVLSLRRA